MVEHLERIGQMVGDYRLLRWLGGGGFGNVYLAEQVRDGQQVALKVLRVRLTRQDELRAFINEARTMRLRHPHIVPLLDFGLSREDTPFLVMEYAPRGTLRDCYPRGARVPLSQAVDYARQVGAALHYAHEQHLIHRDVKPENMLVREDGSILLSDFGIATVAPSSSSLDGEQGMAGTVAYMSSEQLQGRPRAASDQYALAVVIYEWLAGRLPFQGSAVEMAMQHAMQPPPPLRALAPEIPAAVEAVIFKALAKDYRERFASMQEFISALQDASSGATFPRHPSADGAWPPIKESAPLSPLPPARFPPVAEHGGGAPSAAVQARITPIARLAPETTPIPSHTMRTPEPADQFHNGTTLTPANERISTPGRRRRASKGVTAILLVLGALLIAGGSYGYSVLNTMRITALAHQQATATAAARAAATAGVRATATATVKSAVDAYNAYVAQHGIMFGFDAAHTSTNPFEHILSAANVSQLHQAWLAPVSAATADSVLSSPVVANGVVYVGSVDDKLYAFDATTGQQRWAAPTGGSISSSPAVIKGVVYVGSGDGKLYAFDAATGKQRWVAPTNNGIYSSPAVVNGVVYVSSDGKLYAFNAITGKQEWAASIGGQISYSSPAVANRVVYVGSDDGKLYAFDATTGQQRWVAPTGGQSASSPAVANGVVYVSSGDSKLYAFDAVTGHQKWAFPMSSSSGLYDPVVANGVVYVGAGDVGLDAFDPITRQVKWVAATSDPIASLPAVANGVVYVGSAHGELYAFDAATGKQRWIAPNAGASNSPAVVNGVVYGGSGDGYLYAFSLAKSSA
jgi:outer membrane protein assembly factor BamB/serine/threonine protein kinase